MRHRGLEGSGHLRGCRDQFTVVTALPEERLRMGLLEIAGADFTTWNLRCDRQDRHTTAVTVKQPIDQMKIAGAAAPGTDRQIAGNVCVGAGGKGSDFLMADVD